MSAFRNRKPTGGVQHGVARSAHSASCTSEVFDYDDDVTVAAVEQLRKEAEPTMSKGNWKVVDGFVGTDCEPALG